MTRALFRTALPLIVLLSLLLGMGIAFGATLEDMPLVIVGYPAHSYRFSYAITSTARNLGISRDLPDTTQAIDLSPDGRSLFFYTQDWTTGTRETMLRHTLTGATYPLPNMYWEPPLIYWTTHGGWAALLPLDSSDRRLHILDARTGRLTLVFDENPLYLSWSPDGETLTFSLGGIVYLVGHDDDSARAITDETYDFDIVRWSPDSRTLALRSDNPRGLYIIHADGSHLRYLTSGYDFTSVSTPEWSPDGTYLAFNAILGDRLITYSLPVATGELIALIEGPRFPETWIYGVTWSPDGRYLSQLVSTRANTSNLYIVDRDTGAVQFEVAGAVGSQWSPDGTALLYHLPITSSGTRRTYLVQGAAAPHLFQYTGSIMRWAPDGERFLFTRSLFSPAGLREEIERRLYLMSHDGIGRYLTPPGYFATSYAVIGE